MSPAAHHVSPPRLASEAHERIAGSAAAVLRDARLRQRLTLAQVASRARVAVSVVHEVESGRLASLKSYIRIACALGLRPELAFADPRGRRATESPDSDFVHSAMVEAQAGHFAKLGFAVAVDEPYQHYQFAGRADLLTWDRETRALLHVEHRTRFPNTQAAFGSYNSKRAYLPGVVARRLGITAWRSVTNVVAGLWSSEVLHAVRLREASYRALCPDPIEAFAAWWSGTPPKRGASSAFIVFDPAPGRARAFRGLEDLRSLRPRYRSYADAANRLS